MAFGPRLDGYDGVDHEQHRVYLGRGDRLAGHLRVALNTADEAEPATALALIRTALEHHVQDLILHRGTRYVRTQQRVPHAYDRVQAINRAAFHARRETGQLPGLVPVDDDRILYYAEPLARLRRMHTSFTEMVTGVSYQSPWPNPTQRFW